MGSTLITLAITFERLTVVFKPLQAHSMITFGRTKRLVILICSFIVIFSVPMFTYYIFAEHTTPYDSTSNTCYYGFVPKNQESNRHSRSVSPLIDSVVKVYDAVFVSLVCYIPLPIVTVANVALLIKVLLNKRFITPWLKF